MADQNGTYVVRLKNKIIASETMFLKLQGVLHSHFSVIRSIPTLPSRQKSDCSISSKRSLRLEKEYK
jgi:hypothetical protein